jgi:hypothetical protein
VTGVGEERPFRIRVRYCGGCNPEIDRGLVVSRLKEIVEAYGIEVVFGKDGEADWVLLVNGCPRACLEEEPGEGVQPQRCVSVEGLHLDHQSMQEDELPQALWEKILSRLA